MGWGSKRNRNQQIQIPWPSKKDNCRAPKMMRRFRPAEMLAFYWRPPRGHVPCSGPLKGSILRTQKLPRVPSLESVDTDIRVMQGWTWWLCPRTHTALGILLWSCEPVWYMETGSSGTKVSRVNLAEGM